MSCGSETNQFELRYIEELVYGTPPATGDMKIMRNAGVGGGVAKSTTTSEEIRSDRQIVDRIMTKKEPTKDITGEFSFGTWDDWLEAALFSDWDQIHYASDDIEVIDASNYQLPAAHGLTFLPGHIIAVAGFTLAANNGVKNVTVFATNDITVSETIAIEAAGDDVTIDVLGYGSSDIEVLASNIYELATGHGLTFIPGQTILVAGFTDSANNGAKTVSAFSGDQITVEETLVVEAAGDPVTVKWDTLSNGVDKKTFTVEDDFTDVVKVRTMTGMAVGTFALDIPSGSKVGVTLNLLGQNTTVGNSSAVTGTPIEPNDNEIMNAGDHVAEVYEGGVLLALVKDLSFQIENNPRGLDAVGSIENICIAFGQTDVTHTMNVYFFDWTSYQKFLDNTASSLRFQLGDANGTYYFNIPRVKFLNNPVNAGGPNQDVMAEGELGAMRDPTTDKTIIITKVTTT